MVRRAATQSVLLVLLGGTLLKISWTGTYVRYVKVGQHGYLLAAGAILMLVGAANLARMVITCCAADARPVKVGLAGDLPGDPAPDSWLQVTGTYTAQTDTDPVNGEPIPYLTVTAAQPIAVPKLPYES